MQPPQRLVGFALVAGMGIPGGPRRVPHDNHYELAISVMPDRTIEVSADEASGLIRNGKLAGTPR